MMFKFFLTLGLLFEGTGLLLLLLSLIEKYQQVRLYGGGIFLAGIFLQLLAFLFSYLAVLF